MVQNQNNVSPSSKCLPESLADFPFRGTATENSPKFQSQPHILKEHKIDYHWQVKLANYSMEESPSVAKSPQKRA